MTEVVADAEAETRIGLCAEHLGYVLETVVVGVVAGGLEANGAEGERDVVYDNKDALDVYPLLLLPVADGIAGEVHIGRGLYDGELGILDADAGHIGITLGGERS